MSAAVTRLRQDRADCDVDSLRAALEEKDKTLILAGQYGRELLEERDNLKCELDTVKEDNALLRKRLELQEQDAQKVLQESTSAAKVHISQLEEDLDRVNISEETASSQQSLEQLDVENEQLKEEMDQMIRHHKDEMDLMQRKLEVREKETGLMKSEVANFKKKLAKLMEEKQELERCVMLKQHSCEQLAAELQITRQEAEAWEYQCICNEQLLKSQDNELDNTRDMLLQLQQEVNLKETLSSPVCSTPKFSRPSSSLFDELSNQESVPTSPQAVPATATLTPVALEHSDESQGARHSCVTTTIDTSTVDTSGTISCAANPTSASSAALKCPRCAELQTYSQRQQEEIDSIKKQLLAVIQQKIKLHEQVEVWQSDVEEMLGSKVKLQLDNLSSDKNKSKSSKRSRGLLRGSKVDDSSKVKKKSLKNSWIPS